MSKQAAIYFVKYPEPGKVKTRLAKSVGYEEASKRYRLTALDSFNKLKQLQAEDVEVIVAIDPVEKQNQIAAWLSGADKYMVQKGKDLGERLIDAFRRAFEAGYEKVFALSSDTMDLEAPVLSDGFRVLGEDADVVVGPAEDGGYYAIGLTEETPELFVDIPWSTGEVKDTTLQRIKRLQKKSYLMKTLKDLDEAETAETPK